MFSSVCSQRMFQSSRGIFTKVCFRPLIVGHTERMAYFPVRRYVSLAKNTHTSCSIGRFDEKYDFGITRSSSVPVQRRRVSMQESNAGPVKACDKRARDSCLAFGALHRRPSSSSSCTSSRTGSSGPLGAQAASVSRQRIRHPSRRRDIKGHARNDSMFAAVPQHPGLRRLFHATPKHC